MPSGLQVFNQDGSLQFDSSSRLFRVLTVADIGANNVGTVTVPNVQGTLRVVAQAASDTGEAPAITVSGNSMSYDYRGQTNRQQTRVVLMEY